MHGMYILLHMYIHICIPRTNLGPRLQVRILCLHEGLQSVLQMIVGWKVGGTTGMHAFFVFTE